MFTTLAAQSAPSSNQAISGVRYNRPSGPVYEETPMGISNWNQYFSGLDLLGDGQRVDPTNVQPIGDPNNPSGFNIWRADPRDPTGSGKLYQTRSLGINPDGSVYWKDGDWTSKTQTSQMEHFLEAGLPMALAMAGGVYGLGGAAGGGTAATGAGATGAGGAGATGTGAGLATGTGAGTVGTGIGGTAAGGGVLGGLSGGIKTIGSLGSALGGTGNLLNIGGNLLNSYLGYNASNKAADAQIAAAREANALAKYMYDTTRTDNMPALDARNYGLSGYQNLLKDPGAITDDPGYQFGLQQGVNAYDNSGAARGMRLSGAQAKALTRFGQDYGQTKFNESLNRYGNLAGLGQTGAGTIANAGANYANNAGQNIIGAGNAAASGYIGGANAITGGISNFLRGWQENELLRQLGIGG